VADELPVRVTAGDEVRVYYCRPGRVMSFVEGVVYRVDVTTTRGRGFLIDISRDVLFGQEQPVKPGYQHYVLYEQLNDFPEKVEVLPQAQREPTNHQGHGSGTDVEQEPEEEADKSKVDAEYQDEERRDSRIISIFGRRK
jgi:hypothetical protein